MRQFRSSPSNAALLALVLASLAGSSFAATVPLVFENEDVAPFGGLKVTPISGSPTGSLTTLNVTQPVLCGNVLQTTEFPNSQFKAIFPGALAGGDFLFGALNGGLSTTALPGVGSWRYQPSGLSIEADPGLVCYVLDSHGVRKASSGLFSDTFEPNDSNSRDAAIVTRVAELPGVSNFQVIKYFVDVTIPQLSTTTDVDYAIRDGFDGSLFESGNSYYCETAPGAQDCQVSPPPSLVSDNIDIKSKVLANGSVNRRFVVRRKVKNGVTMPLDKPLTIAALYFVNNFETRLDNNVSAGYAALSDLQPNVSFPSGMLDGMVEGGSLVNRTFTISDDTSEIGNPQLNASVSINFYGTVAAATNLSCAQLETPAPGEAVRRTCHFDVPSPGVDFATDVTPGTYANGVFATVAITVTDSRGQTSVRNLPLHVASADNDEPTFSLSEVAVPDKDNGNMPTIHCDLAAVGPFPPQCLGVLNDFVNGLAAGPRTAYDELASQGVFLATLPGGKLGCSASSPSIFSSNLADGLQSPKYVISAGHVGLDYRLSGVAGSVNCNVTSVDYNVPTDQTNKERTVTFRILVTN